MSNCDGLVIVDFILCLTVSEIFVVILFNFIVVLRRGQPVLAQCDWPRPFLLATPLY